MQVSFLKIPIDLFLCECPDHRKREHFIGGKKLSWISVEQKQSHMHNSLKKKKEKKRWTFLSIQLTHCLELNISKEKSGLEGKE